MREREREREREEGYKYHQFRCGITEILHNFLHVDGRVGFVLAIKIERKREEGGKKRRERYEEQEQGQEGQRP